MKKKRKYKINAPNSFKDYKVNRKSQFGSFLFSKLFDIHTPTICVDSLNELTDLLKFKCVLYKDSVYKNIVFEGPKVRMCNIIYKISCIKEEVGLSKDLMPPVELEYELEFDEVYTLLVDFRTMN